MKELSQGSFENTFKMTESAFKENVFEFPKHLECIL